MRPAGPTLLDVFAYCKLFLLSWRVKTSVRNSSDWQVFLHLVLRGFWQTFARYADTVQTESRQRKQTNLCDGNEPFISQSGGRAMLGYTWLVKLMMSLATMNGRTNKCEINDCQNSIGSSLRHSVKNPRQNLPHGYQLAMPSTVLTKFYQVSFGHGLPPERYALHERSKRSTNPTVKRLIFYEPITFSKTPTKRVRWHAIGWRRTPQTSHQNDIIMRIFAKSAQQSESNGLNEAGRSQRSRSGISCSFRLLEICQDRFWSNRKRWRNTVANNAVIQVCRTWYFAVGFLLHYANPQLECI